MKYLIFQHDIDEEYLEEIDDYAWVDRISPLQADDWEERIKHAHGCYYHVFERLGNGSFEYITSVMTDDYDEYTDEELKEEAYEDLQEHLGK